MNEINEKLEESIKSGFEKLSSSQPGSDEWKKTVEQLDTLYKLKLEEDKLKLEEKRVSAQANTDSQKNKEQHLISWVNVGVQIWSTVFMATCYNIWLNKGYKFEETGTIRSPHMRNLIGRILPRLK